MQLLCPHCVRTLDFSGEHPTFCGYCGKPLVPASEAPTAIGSPSGTASYAPTGPPGDAPEVVGNYRLLRPLGAGGMGSVYEAEDCSNGRRVALKLIAADYTASPEAVERFRQEGRLASTLAHPRCVFVLAADEAAGRPYIVMELMPGSTLKDLVDEKGPLSPEEAVGRILDVIDGLREAHRLGLIHRDVKPSNCFLEANGRVKVGDFGLSKSLVHDSQLTRTGTFLGTPLFASPEQIRRDPLDQQSDFYSVAATLYYLLTGQAPFESRDAAATMARIVADSAPSMRSLRPELPRALDRVVLRGLERAREHRWRDLEEFRKALLAFIPGRPTGGGMGIRFGAYLIDYLLMTLVLGLANVTILWLTGSFDKLIDPQAAMKPNPLVLVGQFASIAYFTILDGVWGCSLGKWLLGLRVRRTDGREGPGLGRALARTCAFEFLITLGSIPILLLLNLSGVLGLTSDQFSVAYFASGCLAYPLWFLGIGSMLITMRERNGYRGLHEFLSGTRVVSLPKSEKRLALRRRVDQAVTQPDGLPERVGPYVIRGVPRWTTKAGVLLGEDASLSRKVLIWLRPASAPELPPARREIGRPGRLRWLTSGRQGDSQWDAFLAPMGGALPGLLAGEHLSWAEARPLVEQLTDELVAAAADSTLPPSLTVDQVWIQPDGRVQLLDMPCGSPPGSEESAAHPALTLLRQTALLALEGRPRPTDDAGPPIRAPLPHHAARLLNDLLRENSSDALQRFQAGLVGTRGRPVEVTRSQRVIHLMILSLLLGFGLISMLVQSALPGFAIAMTNLAVVHEGERTLQDLENETTGEFLLAGLDQNPLVRGYAVQRFDQDIRLRDRLWQRVEQDSQQREVHLKTEGWVMGFVRYVMETELRRQPDLPRPGGIRADAANRMASVRIPSERETAVVLYVSALFQLAFWPGLWTVWAFVARGGLSYRVAGVALVRSDGRKAGRFQCAWRTLLLWVPPAVLLALSSGLEVLFWTTWKFEEPYANTWLLWLAWLLWWSVPALLAAYLILSLWSPARSLLDRLVGTYLVPR